jgi:uncharacterized protein (TIGR03435 family)
MRRRLTMGVLLITLFDLGLLARLHGQAPQPSASKTPAFDVASIKPNRSGEMRSGFSTPANRYVATNVTLNDLIGWAYGDPGPPPELRPDYQMSGGPSWKGADRFDVDAITGSIPSTEPVQLLQRTQLKMQMLQTLLAERFKLVVHHETRDGSIYSLILANRDGRLGPQLRRSDTDCNVLLARAPIGAAPPPPPPPPSGPPPPGQVPRCGIQIGPGALRIGSQSIPAIARLLSRAVGRPVNDRTGLNGPFDLSLDFDTAGLPGFAPPPGVTPPNSGDRPSLYTALQEQAGLKLDSGRGPIDVLVIDRVERPTPD